MYFTYTYLCVYIRTLVICHDSISGLLPDSSLPASGNSLDKGIDMGAIVDPSQRTSVDAFVKKAREEGANVFQKCACIPEAGCYYPPTLITNVQPVSTVVQEEVGGALSHDSHMTCSAVSSALVFSKSMSIVCQLRYVSTWPAVHLRSVTTDRKWFAIY